MTTTRWSLVTWAVILRIQDNLPRLDMYLSAELFWGCCLMIEIISVWTLWMSFPKRVATIITAGLGSCLEDPGSSMSPWEGFRV